MFSPDSETVSMSVLDDFKAWTGHNITADQKPFSAL